MKTKSILLLVFLLTSSYILVACSEIQGFPNAMELEESIKEIIISKNENYDFLNDELYISTMEEFINLFIENEAIKKEHFSLGNLDNDNIPELVVFRERNPKNKDDEGKLEVYKFNGEKYALLDAVSMNYDNTNYQLVIGEIAPGQKGLYVNNYVGVHSSITYGFILEDNKLTSILNEKKLNLISPYANNQIKDIDNDGILEFSIPIVDPEVENPYTPDTDKIILWYKWDGDDSGILVKLEREKGANSNDTRISNKNILEKTKTLLEERDYIDFLNYISENKDNLSLKDNTKLLKHYLSILNESLYKKNIEINNLFSKYQLGKNYDYLIEKYNLSIENLNNLNYINRDEILESEKYLKEHIVDNLNLGYKIKSIEGMYNYEIDYQRFLDKFENDLLKEYKDYLKILSLNTNESYLIDGSLMISYDKLAERIVLLENYKMTYPYSSNLEKIDEIYKEYISTFILGSTHIPNYNLETYKVSEDILGIFESIAKKYPHTNFADIIISFLQEIEINENQVNKDIIDEYKFL